ncbi:hypothetical protein DPMN_006750 [Dreissena polymorpha]|uniref:Uncharacterized protein n=1 Tax=Dreissena polymorpha TaxID=45954 RepID=A0A9D4MV67_DREPO|nr:hypothetical protein DPMN_006750 [Dreissena polymorpha]
MSCGRQSNALDRDVGPYKTSDTSSVGIPVSALKLVPWGYKLTVQKGISTSGSTNESVKGKAQHCLQNHVSSLAPRSLYCFPVSAAQSGCNHLRHASQ